MNTARSLLLAVLVLCAPGQSSKRTPPEEFHLTVTLLSPGKPVELSAKIFLGKTFGASEAQNGRRITIKGVLTEKKANRYHLRLTIVDWASEKQNSSESYEPDLVPGEPWRSGYISSFLYKRTVLLTRVPVH